MGLVTGKRLARSSPETTVNLFAGVDGSNKSKNWSTLMFGRGGSPLPNLEISTSLKQLGEQLEDTTSLIILSPDKPLGPGAADTLLSATSTPSLKSVILVTKLGCSNSKGGIFGGNSGKVKECEDSVRALVQGRGVPMSVLRVGTLKGGGPGKVVDGEVRAREGQMERGCRQQQNTKRHNSHPFYSSLRSSPFVPHRPQVEGEELGLSKNFYDTQAQLEKFMMISGYDKFTLGCSLIQGDPLKPANPIVRQGRSISFDPYPDECSVITAAAAVVFLVGYEGGVDATISAEKGERAPTDEEFEEMFSNCRP